MKAKKTIYCTKGYLNALGFDKEKLVRELMHNAKGTFFSGAYVKLNGDHREFNGKEVVYGKLKGGDSTLEKGQIAYVDNNAGGWRSFKVGRLKRLQVNGINHVFDVDED